MNISKLRVGMEIKSYKELCGILDIPIKSGNTKIAQLKEFSRYFSYVKDGNSFKITGIYDVVKDEVDNRIKGNASVYLPYFEFVFLSNLANNMNEDNDISVFEFTTKRILYETGMCNARFLHRDIYAEISNESSLDVTKFDVNDFLRRTGFKFNRLVNSMLSNLRNRAILNVRQVYKIRDEDNKTRVATLDEETNIVDAERFVLNKLGFTSKMQVCKKFKTKEFYDELQLVLHDRYNWISCYLVYQISFVNKNLKSNIRAYKREVERVKSNKLNLNNKICESINNQAVELYKKNKDLRDEKIYITTDWGKNEKPIFKLKDNYVKNQYDLTEYLIKIM